MLKRTLSESGISAPVEGSEWESFVLFKNGLVGIKFQSKKDLLESCLSLGRGGGEER